MKKTAIFENILKVIEETKEYQPCEDGLAYWLKIEGDQKEKHILMLELIKQTTKAMQESVRLRNYKNAEQFRTLIFKMYAYDGQTNFESYMIALEYDREPRERFFLPRR